MDTTPRLKDVAALADVSVASASLVLSGHSRGRVSEATAQRIRQAAADLGYVARHHDTARGADHRRNATYGFITDTVVTKPYAVDLLAEAAQSVAAEDAGLVITTSNGDPRSEALAVANLKARKVDYIAIVCMKHRAVRLPRALERPTIIVNGYSPDTAVPAVVPNEVQGAYDATRALIEAGHHRLGFLNDAESRYAAPLRLQGFRRALRDAGLPQSAGVVMGTRPHPGTCDAAAAAMLALPERPTGIFCFNDGIAAGLYRAARRARVRIPTDLSVIGFDNLLLISANLDPGLTTMQLPHRQMTRWALRYLRDPDAMEGVTWPMHFRCDLVERDSIAPRGA
ncbi:LacI family DNA-binding transcriptional regulator [Nanchangia anserum]|uniref:LacI family DNA-binding transcriptional regulator n=1 Tax=Nanchangia anserum TaxID=2692125 RepID=A0A8I0GBB0_9ACTO|nr:LacI family DNA-binding transcriptional regulator [Nanchangia anserum]MBD3688871.1 LacI family DNA-binding transcriptional regulator [Nanchangia anserum]QOX81139.1 LacI family DNA-binding transcriptional regulator [Nanchangia anserum]